MNIKKWIIGLVALLSLSSSAGVQSFGVFLVGASYNTYDPGKAEGFRVSLRTYFVSVDVQADWILGRIDNLASAKDLSLYYGAGANAGFGFYYGSLSVGAHGIVGLEYRLNPGMSIFLDFCPGIQYYFTGGPSFYSGGALGLNLKL